MPPPDFEIVRIERLRPSRYRGVVILACTHDPEVNAREVFSGLAGKRLNEVRSRLDTWIEGVAHNDRWFHGFRASEYRDCFVFKWKDRNKGQRLYGFLCNPLPKTNRAFRLCVLTNHAVKPAAQWETDPLELIKANALRYDPYVMAAIAVAFPDEVVGEKQWKH